MSDFKQELLGFARKIAVGSRQGAGIRIKLVKSVLWFFTGMAAVIAVARFTHGLGAVTALSDTTPWGLWIGFDVLSGVALAAGGFVVAATVYIFHLDRYHALVRPAVLTAFLGYAAVVLGLLFDLGLAWNIWRPVFNWQYHSALFEVAWCVMLYLTVLALEFAPVVFEKMPFPRVYRFLKKVTLPLVILGIMLSTLHQSSLGSLFLIMPFRLNPLWYSPVLPQLFFISAIALGLAMVGVESRITAWLYGRKPEEELLQGLARAASFVLAGYLALRLGDLAIRGILVQAFQRSWESALFIFEILLSAVVPSILFAVPRFRKKPGLLTAASSMVVVGFVLNRIDVSGIATITVTGSRYIPAWTEVAISLGIVCFMALIFLFLVERFDVYPEAEPDSAAPQPEIPLVDPVTGVRLEAPWAAPSTIYSLVFVCAAALTAGMLPESAFHGPEPEHQAVEPVRFVTAHKFIIETPERGEYLRFTDVTWKGDSEDDLRVMMLDGNRNGLYVLFDHDAHKERNGGLESCFKCHHMNKPYDQATSCAACHADFFTASSTFHHKFHVEKLGGNSACGRCHKDPNKPKALENTESCESCHTNMVRRDSLVEVKLDDRIDLAPSYVDAMHKLCADCHKKSAFEKPELGTNLGRCATCHSATNMELLKNQPPYSKIKLED